MSILDGADRTASPRPLLAPLRRQDPARIGPYTLLGRLGAGAMGRVYLGRSTAGRLVAVKTIRDEYAEEPDFRDRFAHEVAAARRVSGVFTAAVVAADAEAEVPWLATAYVAAPSLATLVETCGPLPVPAVRWLAAGCAEALESIHSVGLLHRDLKPSNVLVSLDGPQVIDFGVARAVERVQLTATREALGTPAYMAPEQARETRRIGPASDVFSLGSTLLYAATGHAPYQGETTVDVLVRLATEEPDLSGLPPELAGTVAACLDRDPERRPTPAALLAQIAATMRFEHGDGDGARSLPERALALIEEHRRRPPAALAPAVDADSTFGSQSSLPTSLPDLVVGPSTPPPRAAATPPAATPPAQPKHSATRPTDRRLMLALAALLAIVLVGGGVAAGALLLGNDTPPATQGQGPPPNGRPPGPPPSPPGGQPITGPPAASFNQPFGDGDTTPVLSGSNLPPTTEVTITLKGHGSPVTMRTDRTGTFHYTFNQGHEFFDGPVPRGDYDFVVSYPKGEDLPARYSVGGP
ncbi:MAG TPA: serine/threonine-protein kinase [Mycobacteriales bacterium]|nr:serine/threonine-protein kinase [Mycobacteriales bacterium]